MQRRLVEVRLVQRTVHQVDGTTLVRSVLIKLPVNTPSPRMQRLGLTSRY